MYTYSAYGLDIQSAFELPELPVGESDGSAPDVVFSRGTVEPVPQSVNGTKGRRVRARAGQCRLSYDSYGSFLVSDGESVRFDPLSEDVLETKAIRRLLENEMLGVLLHQRGRLVLHASAVAIDGEVALFVGPRGAGKSTTAAALHRRGHPIMEDDIVSVRFEDGIPIVDPGVPEMRLNSDVVDTLDIKGTREYEDDAGPQKRYDEFEETPDPAPLGRCYALEKGDKIAIETLSQREQLFGLTEATYTQGLIPDTESSERHFQQCSEIVETTPFHRLTRPDDFKKLPAFLDAIVENILSYQPGAE